RQWEAQPPPTHHWASWFAARLRLQARRDPVAALALLTEAVDEVGAAEIGIALESVVFRAVRVDPAAVWRHFTEDAVTLTHRARCAKAAGIRNSGHASRPRRSEPALAAPRRCRSPPRPGPRWTRPRWRRSGNSKRFRCRSSIGSAGGRRTHPDHGRALARRVRR